MMYIFYILGHPVTVIRYSIRGLGNVGSQLTRDAFILYTVFLYGFDTEMLLSSLKQMQRFYLFQTKCCDNIEEKLKYLKIYT